jgi:hypothetical protein
VNLFQLDDFTLNCGLKASWKIECDALTDDDWLSLASMATAILPSFRIAEGVPRGGFRFATALNAHATGNPGHPLLIADDVLTTGNSMERYRAGRDAIGVTAFSRGMVRPFWVHVLFGFDPRPAVILRSGGKGA